MRKTFKLISIFCLAVVAAVAVVKFDRFANAYYYVFYGGPYVNRVFQTSYNVVSRDDPLFRKLVYDSDFRDRRGHMPDFALPFEKQVTVSATPTEKAEYLRFLEKYFRILKTKVDASGSPGDAMAFAIMGLSYEYFRRNRADNAANKFDFEKVFAVEASYRAEDFVYYLVNAFTACGTVGEATVALLRYAGFRTRLIRISIKPDPPTASHVFLEFYSNDQQRWVMLDPMINTSPRTAENSLSVFEILDRPEISSLMNKRWQVLHEYNFPIYKSERVAWYVVRGPVSRIYYYSADPEVRGKLRKNLL